MIAAAGGSLCIWSKRTPRDFAAVQSALRDPSSRVQLIVCAPELSQCKAYLGSPIVLPPLAERAAELSRIVDEYVADATIDLALDEPLGAEDRAWIVESSSTSLPEIAKGARRLVAIRKAASMLGAAELLGMSHTALSRWIGRRSLPVLRRRGA
jgi:hypothetical protein